MRCPAYDAGRPPGAARAPLTPGRGQPGKASSALHRRPNHGSGPVRDRSSVPAMTRLVAGRLLLLGVVGTGSHGPVRRAWDLRAHRQVVVKREAPRPLHLEHPHVLPQEQIGDLVVSPFVRGGSVEQLLASYGALPGDLVAVLLDQLLDALGAVHDAGWVHRDVKPGNLLLEPPERRSPPLAGRPGLGPADREQGSARRDARLRRTRGPRTDPGGPDPRPLRGRDDGGRAPHRPGAVRRAAQVGPLRPLLRSLVDPDPATPTCHGGRDPRPAASLQVSEAVGPARVVAGHQVGDVHGVGLGRVSGVHEPTDAPRRASAGTGW